MISTELSSTLHAYSIQFLCVEQHMRIYFMEYEYNRKSMITMNHPLQSHTRYICSIHSAPYNRSLSLIVLYIVNCFVVVG